MSLGRKVRAVNIFCLDRLVNISIVHRNRPLTSVQLEKLMTRFQNMIGVLAEKKELRLHANIDQFYYMQKLVELRLLVSILKASCPAETLLHEKIRERYTKMFCTWKKDARYLSEYLRAAERNLTRIPFAETDLAC